MVCVAEEDHVNHGRTTSKNGKEWPGQSMLSLLLIAETEIGRWAVIAADASVDVRMGVTSIS